MRNLALLIVFLMSLNLVTAQNATASSKNSSVLPLSSFLKTYKEKQLTISTETKERTDLSVAEKLMLYENEISKLKESFKTSRQKEYSSKVAKRAKRLSCTGKHTRNVTKCEPVLINAPNGNMYTKKEWIEIEATKDITVVVDDNSTISLSLSATGKRTNKAVVYATYKYKPESIMPIVNQEVINLFSSLKDTKSEKE